MEKEADDPDFGFASTVVMLRDILMRCKSDKDADMYLTKVFSTASTTEKERVYRAYFGISLAALKKKYQYSQKGGFNDQVDQRILTMLAAADTFHDFQELAEKDVDDMVVGNLPREVTLNALKKEKLLVTTLAKPKHLTFGNSKIENPFYRANIMDTFDVLKSIHASNSSLIDVDDIYRKQARHAAGKLGSRCALVPIDIMTLQGDSNKEILKLEQVARVICTLRRLYGHTVEFVVDASGHPLTTLVVSLKFIDKSLLNKFEFDAKDISAKLVSLCKRRQYSGVAWETKTCDATLFDSAINAVGIDTSPTGSVYSHRNYQVDLHGAEQRPSGKILKFRIYSASTNATMTRELTGKQAAKYFSINHLKAIMTKSISPSDPIDSSLAAFDNETLYAVKRAGDWGQVQHCKIYDKVFVTRDKLAAMYARACGVKFVFMAFEQTLSSQMLRLLPEGFPSYFRYSFTCSRP